MTWLKFIHVQIEVTLMAVQFINIESFFLLRKFIGPKNPLMSASIAYFVFLRRSEKNIAAQKCIWCLCANLATMWVCVFCCDGQNEAWVGRKYQFSSNMFPCLRPGQCSIPQWDLYYIFMKFISSKVLGFLLLVLVYCEINTVHYQGPAQWKGLWLFHTQNRYTWSRPKPGVNG